MTPVAKLILNAAKKACEQNMGGCRALRLAIGDSYTYSIARNGFYTAFKINMWQYKWKPPFNIDFDREAAVDHEARIIGLLLLHEMAKDAGL